MKLLFVGKTDFKYNRDAVLLSGLRRLKEIEVTTYQIHSRNWKTFQQIRKQSQEVDFVIVPSFRHKDIAFIKCASKSKVVFDPLISKYMTRVLDYGVKWKAPHKLLVDWFSFFWPDILIWDTKAHQSYLSNKYRLKKPMLPIYIGVDTRLFYPIPNVKKEEKKIVVGFYGSFNPLQGVDKIVKAAKLLEPHSNIQFRIIGSGSTFKKTRDLAKTMNVSNIDFIPPVPFITLNEEINQFDICLGVFGDSIKTDVVIPNKIYHYAATKKCIITKDTKAIKEIFTHNEDIVLVKNDASNLAESILLISQNESKQSQIANAAFNKISTEYNQDKIAESFVKFLRSCLS